MESLLPMLALIVVPVLILFSACLFIARQYKRCPSNRILVIFGKVGEGKTAKCIRGGGSFVIPLIQGYQFLSLEPMNLNVPLSGALSKTNIRVNVPANFTLGIGTQPHVLQNAAERLLGLTSAHIQDLAKEIIFGQLRLVVATLTIEEINQDREMFLNLIAKNLDTELHKIGLEVINVNITDLTDESNYLKALGQKNAAEAVQQAHIDVAQQERKGAIGVKEAEREQRVKVASADAEAIKGENTAKAQVAQSMADLEIKKKDAQREQRTQTATLEASAVVGENEARVTMANSQAELEVKQADAHKKGKVAQADADAAVLVAQKEVEVARLRAAELAKEEVEKQKVEVQAEAEAEKIRRIAKGEADAVKMKYEAEAEGLRKVLNAKAEGYESLVKAAGGSAEKAATLLYLEQTPTIVETMVKAIAGVKIDNVTVWDTGSGQGSGVPGFLQNLISTASPLHGIAKNAGIKLPEYFGSMIDKPETPVEETPET